MQGVINTKSISIQSLSNELTISILSFLHLKDCVKYMVTSRKNHKKLNDPHFIRLLMSQLRHIHIPTLQPSKSDAISFFKTIYRTLSYLDQLEPAIIPWIPLDATSTDKN